jgi:hypothetical protein
MSTTRSLVIGFPQSLAGIVQALAQGDAPEAIKTDKCVLRRAYVRARLTNVPMRDIWRKSGPTPAGAADRPAEPA